MRIGGFEKQSLIDWQGKVAAVIFTKGCNFRCGYCHNPALVLPELFHEAPDYDEDKILHFLEERKAWLDGVVITGGEPTLHHDLTSYIKKIKSLNLPVKLDTNGTNPEMLQSLIQEGLIDCVAMDIKTIPMKESYQKITGIPMEHMMEKIHQSISIIRKSSIEYEFRTTIIPGQHSETNIGRLKEMFMDDVYSLQEYRDGNTVEKYFG